MINFKVMILSTTFIVDVTTDEESDGDDMMV